MKMLNDYDWPGNVRQLEHLIDQIVITNNSTELTVQMLPAEITSTVSRDNFETDTQTGSETEKPIPSIAEMERMLILQALELSSNSVPAAARHLGLSEATLYRKIKKYKIPRTGGITD